MRPSASSRSSSRQRKACVSTLEPGYHLKGTETTSASWPRSRSSCASVSVKISAPPYANGTCGRQTAILIRCRCARARCRARPQRIHLFLQVVDQTQGDRVERALVVRDAARRTTASACAAPPSPACRARREHRVSAAASGRPRPARAARPRRAARAGRTAPEPPPGSAPERRTSSRSRARSAATSTGRRPRRSRKSLQNPGFPRCPQASGHSSPGVCGHRTLGSPGCASASACSRSCPASRAAARRTRASADADARADRHERVRGARAAARTGGRRRAADTRRVRVPGVHERRPGRLRAMGATAIRRGALRRHLDEFAVVHYPLTIPPAAHEGTEGRDAARRAAPRPARPLLAARAAFPRRRLHRSAARRRPGDRDQRVRARARRSSSSASTRARSASIHLGVDHERFRPGQRAARAVPALPGPAVAAQEPRAALRGFALLRRAPAGAPARAHGRRHDPARCPTASRPRARVRSTSSRRSLPARGGSSSSRRLYEGFGLPPLEAMACGCPVAVLDAGVAPRGRAATRRACSTRTIRDAIAAAVEDVLASPGRVGRARPRPRGRLHLGGDGARAHDEVYRELA